MRLLGLAIDGYGWLPGTVCLIFMVVWETWKVNWARLDYWRGVCGIGGMTRYEQC